MRVRREHDVVVASGKALACRILLDVQQSEAHALNMGEALDRPLQEERRDIGEGVVHAAGRQGLENGGTGRARSRADLQHPQTNVGGRGLDRRAQRRGQRPVEGPRRGSVVVETARILEGAVREQQGGGIDPIAQSFGQRTAAAA